MNDDIQAILRQPEPTATAGNSDIQAILQQPEVSGGSAFLSGIQHGFKRAIQGIQQIGAHAGIAGPEDINPPLGEEAARAFDARLRATILPEETALAPVQKAHPWLYGLGNVGGGIAVTAPLAALVPGAGYTALALQGGLAGLAQPALGPDYGKEKIGQAAVGAGLGLVGGGILKSGLPALASLWNFPKQFVNQAQVKALETPYAQRGLELAQETGMTLSPAMVSGSRLATQAENVARQSMWSSDKALESYRQLSDQAVNYADRLTQEWTQGRGAPDAISLGQNLRDTIRQAVTGIHGQAGKQWQQDMSMVIANSPPGFSFANTRAALQQVIEENTNNLTDAGLKVKGQAQTLLDRLTAAEQNTADQQIPIKSAVALRQQFGRAAKGSGNIFTDIHPAEDRRLAGQLFGAINADFDSAANNAGGPMGDAFKRANQNYRAAMGSIDYIEKSVLGKALGKDVTDALYSGQLANTSVAPETLAGKISRLPASALEQTRIILEQQNPALLQDLKAYTLQQAIDRGQTLAPSMGTRITFDPAKAATGLLNPQQRAALYSPEESRAVGMLDESLRRWADRHGYNFSGTAPTQEFLHWVNRLGVGVLGLGTAAGSMLAGGPAGLLGAAAAGKQTLNYIFGTRQIAEAMLNPGDRMQLLTLVRLPAGDQRAAQIAGMLLAKYGTQQDVTGNQ